ncbi:MAG: peptidoglycan DD-metalloendopeptidase family protein [Minisyncoccia bacterium]
MITFVLGFYPAPAHAGFFTDLKSFFSDTAEASTPHTLSVQTIPLVRPAMNHDPNPAKGGAEVAIEDESVLHAQGGFGGQTVQSNKDAISIHVVRPGETLSEIAELYGVSVNTIIWANDLPRNGSVKAGQMLTILPISGLKYTVKDGDTLESIAKKYHGDASEIAQYNDINGSVAVGAEILIPNGEAPAPVAPKVAAPSMSAPAAKSPVSSGYYSNPLPNGVRTQGIHGYNGVDLAVPSDSNAPIVAAAGGDVIIAREGGWNGGYGSYVVVKHDNGTQTLYAHMSSVSIGVGQSVQQGQLIGYVGNSGRSTGPHLHFEIRGGPRNPF